MWVEEKDKVDVDKYKALYEESLEKVEKERLMSSLLLDKTVREIHRIIDLYQCGMDATLKQKDEKKKKDRPNWEWLIKQIKNDFFPNVKVKYVNHMSCGYEHYADTFIFNCNDKEISIYIPCIKNITVQNVEFAYWGKFHAYVRIGKYTTSSLGFSYNIEDIRMAIEKEVNKIGDAYIEEL